MQSYLEWPQLRASAEEANTAAPAPTNGANRSGPQLRASAEEANTATVPLKWLFTDGGVVAV